MHTTRPDPVYWDRVTPVHRTVTAGPIRRPAPVAPWVITADAHPANRPGRTEADRLATRLETDAIWQKLEAQRIRDEQLAATNLLVATVEATMSPEQKRYAASLRKSKRVKQPLPAVEKRLKLKRAREAQARAFREKLKQRTAQPQPVTASARRPSPPEPRWRPMPDGYGVYDASLMTEADARRLTWPARR